MLPRNYCTLPCEAGSKLVLTPEGIGIFPEFLDKNPGIPGGWQLYMGASKISMDVAEPLPRVSKRWWHDFII